MYIKYVVSIRGMCMIVIKSKLYESRGVTYEYDKETKKLYIPMIKCTLEDIDVDDSFEDSLLSYVFDNLFAHLYNARKRFCCVLDEYKAYNIVSTEVNQIDESYLADDITYKSEVDW